MAQLKKMMGEIEKAQKKVDEGVEEYNRLREAHSRASQPNQKEKLEENLKAQIKKLQRERNQIIAWIGDKNVKDKNPLNERKDKIEVLMDHFKEFERESKTKRYSQVGLTREDRADPDEQQRRELTQWFRDTIGNLGKEIDERTATEQLLSKKPSKGSKEEASTNFSKRVHESLRWHITKLEQVLRKLNNDQLDLESLEGVKDSLEMYTNEEVNPRTAEGFQGYEDVYDDLNLEEVEDYLLKDASKENLDEKDDEKEEPPKKEEPKPKEVAKPAAKVAPTISTRHVVEDKVEKPKLIATRSAPAAALHPSQPTHAQMAAQVASLAPLAAPSAVPPGQAPKQPPVAPAPPQQAPPPQAPPAPHHLDSGSSVPTVPPPSKPPPSPDAVPQAAATLPSAPSIPAMPAVPVSMPHAHEPPAMPPPPPPSVLPSGGPGPKKPPAPIQAAQVQGRMQGPPPPPNEAPPVPERPQDVAKAAAQVQAAPAVEGAAEPLLAYTDIPPLTEAQERAHALLEASGRFLPLPSDVPKPRRYSPTTPYVHKDPNGQPYYPVEPARSFDDPGAFERYDVDTLFFIFYYQQGTYQQYLAAKELKKLSWRYHTKHLMWFQRHEEPRMTAAEFERGTYVYFDYETQWNQRLKADFTFEYVWLESADV